MIKLYSFGPGFGVADPSPFVLKVDAYLRIAGIPYESISSAGNLRKAPKEKLPFIDDDGQIIADSQIIFDYLEAKRGDEAFDGWLSNEQKATNWLLTKAMDDHLYWCGLHSRWAKADTWPLVREEFFGEVPALIRPLLAGFIRRGILSSLKGHGMGRHSDAEILEFNRRTLESLSILLGDKDYFFGSGISTLDITTFAFFAQSMLATIDNDSTKMARQFANLVAFCGRLEKQYYPEFAEKRLPV